MADEKEDANGDKLPEQFQIYIVKSAQLMLGIETGTAYDHLETFLGTDTAKEAMTQFIQGEYTTFVLEMQSSMSSKGSDDDPESEGEVIFSVFREIPDSSLDAAALKKTYLLVAI